ncbi:tetratricopeptide repeat protein [Alicyclobacillus vulcanalis]|uniref:tetratricopeptide repeat protein n=1 Tax=Alicyclobacillus vulcanalis TaxID=252246 RepID=UPI001356534C|nr:tetratricopeptide repeat protein [Alicyclobacillus vulcanalis]
MDYAYTGLSKQITAVTTVWKERIKMEPNWTAVVETGWTYKDDESRLVEYFAETERQHPSSARAKFELARALDYLGREAEAIPLYEEAVRLGLSAEYHAYALLQLGSSLRNVGRVDEAVQVLIDAQRRYPELPSISMFLGLSLYSQGNKSEALKIVMRAMLQYVQSSDIERYREAIISYIDEIE